MLENTDQKNSKYGKISSSADCFLCDALRNSVSFAQFKKQEKHQWRSDTFSKVADFGLELYLKCSSMDLFHVS